MTHDLLTEQDGPAAPAHPGESAPVPADATAAGDEPAAPPPRPVPDPSPVLTEVPGDTGLVLWLALRDVLAWARRPGEERAAAFGPGAAAIRRAALERVTLHPELAGPLGVLADLVAHPAGGHGLPLLVTHACLRVARHLCARGAGAAALVFAQAAALSTPHHPRPLVEVGRLLGPARAGEARAALLRAAELLEEHERRTQRAEPALRAEIHAELAALAFRRGEPRAARGHLLTAARRARREAR